jgi:hypothetical protein
MKARVYIETTIPSYLVARPSRDLLIAAHQQLTRDWRESRRAAFDLYISELVLEEAAAGDAFQAKERLDLMAGIRILALTRKSSGWHAWSRGGMDLNCRRYARRKS